MSDFESKLKTFVEGCNKIYNDHMDESFPNNPRQTIEHRGGRKYAKLVTVNEDGKSSSAFCFVNTENGDVLKSASWSAPAKGARGNVYDDNNGLARMTPYGAGYNR